MFIFQTKKKSARDLININRRRRGTRAVVVLYEKQPTLPALLTPKYFCLRCKKCGKCGLKSEYGNYIPAHICTRAYKEPFAEQDMLGAGSLVALITRILSRIHPYGATVFHYGASVAKNGATIFSYSGSVRCYRGSISPKGLRFRLSIMSSILRSSRGIRMPCGQWGSHWPHWMQ